MSLIAVSILVFTSSAVMSIPVNSNTTKLFRTLARGLVMPIVVGWIANASRSPVKGIVISRVVPETLCGPGPRIAYSMR